MFKTERQDAPVQLSPQSTNLDRTTFENLIPPTLESGHVLDLGNAAFVKPWGVMGLCSLLVDLRCRNLDFRVVEPASLDVRNYLRRVRFHEFVTELGLLESHFPSLAGVSLQEHEVGDRLIELTRLRTRADFQAREEQLAVILQRIGMDEDRSYLAVGLIAEAVDNIFIHNFGKWPFVRVPGGLVMAQKWPRVNTIEVAIGDFGAGIRTTLAENPKYRDIATDEMAIQRALEQGVTSRQPERGGNGLTYILWTIQADLKGKMDIRSGDCHIQSNGGIKTLYNGKRLIGTMIGLTINY